MLAAVLMFLLTAAFLIVAAFLIAAALLIQLAAALLPVGIAAALATLERST